MKRSLFAFGLMIGAALLARAVLAQQPVQPGRASPPNPLLEAFDTDRDGALSAAEIDAAAAKLRECDADHDGKLTADELLRGGRRLRHKVGRHRPRFVAFLGVTAYRVAFARPEAKVGRQHERLAESGIWVLPNPSGLNAHYQLADLARVFEELRRAVE